MGWKEITEISKDVRDRVYERDSFDGWVCCIVCGFSNGIEIHHYIERSRGGKGIEENLVCLCSKCHRKAHNEDREVKDFIREYLSYRYEGWDETKLIIKKE